MDTILAITFALIILILMFLPVLTAFQRKTNNIAQVAIINIFLGWTIIGWVIALVMAYKPKQ